MDVHTNDIASPWAPVGAKNGLWVRVRVDSLPRARECVAAIVTKNVYYFVHKNGKSEQVIGILD